MSGGIHLLVGHFYTAAGRHHSVPLHWSSDKAELIEYSSKIPVELYLSEKAITGAQRRKETHHTIHHVSHITGE